jgi:hypothetical protein
MLAEVIWLDRAEGIRRSPELRIVRVLRRYVSKRTRRPYRGGAFLDYGGKLSAQLREMLETLRRYYGETPKFDPMALPSWEAVEEGVGNGCA